MVEIGREDQEPKIIREWTSKEINPQEIADALGGMLEQSADDDSKLDILFIMENLSQFSH